MATVSGLEVDFETNLIDPLYMNAAIYEMNKKTEEGFYELSKHISDLYTFIFIVGELLTTYQPQELITLIKTTAPKWTAGLHFHKFYLFLKTLVRLEERLQNVAEMCLTMN